MQGEQPIPPDAGRTEPLLIAGALQRAIFLSAHFSSIATDALGVIQVFNVGAERMLGYTAAEVTNKITPAEISDPQEVIARARALSVELGTTITPGFEALAFKASRGIEDIYELTYIRKDGSRFPAVVSVTALRDAREAIIGYLLIGTDNTARKEAEAALIKAGALQSAIFNSANFSSIATDAKGVIQIFNVGAERMLGYAAVDVMNKITPADISDPQEVIARARALSVELGTTIAPGFEALAFKASRGIEDIYELTYIRRDGSRFPAVVSVTALRDAGDAGDAVIGYLLIGTDNTARKQIEEERGKLDQRLRDQHFYTRSLIESNVDALMAIDLRGIITDVNKESEILTGCTRDELIGAPFKNYFTDPARAEAAISRVLSERKIADYELTTRPLDGMSRIVSCNATTFHDRNRILQGVFVAARDVTELKRLVQSQARLTALYGAGIIGIVVTAQDGRVIEINDALLGAIGYTREEILSGRIAWESLTPPRWRETADRAEQQLKTTGVALREKEYLHKGGGAVPVLVGSTRLAGGNGETISFVLDLTAKHTALAAEHLREARASEVAFRGLLEAAPDAMVIADSGDRMVFVNGAAKRLFGYSREELIGQPVKRLVPEHPSHREGSAANPGGRRLGSALELFGRRKDGTVFPIELTLGPVETEQGIRVSSAIRDITERKATETALKAANLELEAFSYSVAHDLRAPLRGMNGFAQVLLDSYKDKLDAEGQDWLNEILLNARKMGELIDALLSLARVTRSELHFERVNLSELVRQSAARWAELDPGRAVEVEIQPGLHAFLDPQLASALIENLVGNAWKFTGKALAARIQFGVSEKSGAFFVRDNGAGFDMAFADKLFGPFQRLHTVAEFPGTGVGLATVQRILHRHGGRIWAEGSVNGGATFFFTLPGDQEKRRGGNEQDDLVGRG